MPMSEFKNSLHALQYTSDLPEGIILGFKDNQGKQTSIHFLEKFLQNGFLL